jgi:hypothetical protein
MLVSSSSKMETHSIILDVSVTDVLSIGDSFVSGHVPVLVLLGSRGERDRIGHEARLVLALPVCTVVTPLLQSVTAKLLMMGM